MKGHAMSRPACAAAVVLLLFAAIAPMSIASGEDRVLHRFERRQLTNTYYSEGAGAGDIDGDGVTDIVYGPYWFAGPQFQEKHEIYPARPQPTERYADNFFSWVYDFNSDGASDVFVVGFPGTPAYVYENPTKDHLDRPWKKHQVLDAVSNESPHFTDLVGDERPEVVCTQNGFFGYAAIDWTGRNRLKLGPSTPCRRRSLPSPSGTPWAWEM
jgi:hypothetical protein